MTEDISDILSSDRDWMLSYIGDDQITLLEWLASDLSKDASPNGEGKVIRSGYSYWGIGPTLGWARASLDPAYPNARQAVDSFAIRWAEHTIKSAICDDGISYAYVSLGIGTADKDIYVIHDLASNSDKPILLFAVDVSAEMLKLAVNKIMRSPVLQEKVRPLAIQVDFSLRQNVTRLRDLILRVIGEKPILYSLLGNTIGNFANDTERLTNLAAMMRPQDRMLIEVGQTERGDDEARRKAQDEYQKSRPFQKFALGSILAHTDLPLNFDCVKVISSLETLTDNSTRSLLLKILYVSDSDRRFMLPHRDFDVEFPKGDTIRIYLTRKYTEEGVHSLISDSDCVQLGSSYIPFVGSPSDRHPYFGLSLHLLSRK